MNRLLTLILGQDDNTVSGNNVLSGIDILSGNSASVSNNSADAKIYILPITSECSITDI